MLVLPAERTDRGNAERAWLTRIPCANGGFIAPAGGRQLMAFATVEASPALLLPCVRIQRESADEAIAIFDAAHLETVAGVLGAKRRRRLSNDQRARLKTAGANTRFSGPETTITPEAGQCLA